MAFFAGSVVWLCSQRLHGFQTLMMYLLTPCFQAFHVYLVSTAPTLVKGVWFQTVLTQNSRGNGFAISCNDGQVLLSSIVVWA